jgi:transcriptional regulator with XRE-family HTH domain
MAKPQNGVAARWLGMELRRFREAAGLSLDTVAAVLDWSASTLSRMERSGRAETTPEEVSALLACMQVRGEDRARTMRLARTLQYQGSWEWEAIGGATSDSARVYATLEAAAVRIVDVEPLLVPGLLQTADYCRALLQGLGVEESAIMGRMARRLGRQEMLARSNSAEVVFVIGESALRRPLPTRMLMARQVRHIAKQAELPRVSVHVLPDSVVAHPALRGSFVVLEFEEAPPIAMVEARMSGHFPEGSAEISAFKLDAERMVDLALGEHDSIELLHAIAEDLERAG